MFIFFNGSENFISCSLIEIVENNPLNKKINTAKEIAPKRKNKVEGLGSLKTINTGKYMKAIKSIKANIVEGALKFTL
jgi:hypothetical protein